MIVLTMGVALAHIGWLIVNFQYVLLQWLGSTLTAGRETVVGVDSVNMFLEVISIVLCTFTWCTAALTVLLTAS